MREYFVWLLKFLTVVVVMLLVPIVVGGVIAALGGNDIPVSGKNLVAVVELKGAIESSREVIEKLHKQINNPKVKGIVLAIDSPGGAVGPAQDIYTEVLRLKSKKPIVAAMSSVAASGGLYAALGASKIYAQPGTITGSIGVILQIPNFRKVAEMVGVDMVTIKSGKFKDVGNSFRDMTDEEREFLQSTIGVAYEDFVSAVSTGRGIPAETVRSFADGRIILGSQAKELKLIDEHGSVYDAARAVFALQGTPLKDDEEPTLYYAKDRFEDFQHIFESITDVFPRISAKSFELRYAMF